MSINLQEGLIHTHPVCMLDPLVHYEYTPGVRGAMAVSDQTSLVDGGRLCFFS